MEEIVRYSSTLLGILKPQIRNTEDHCGEHRLLACPFRQPAEKPLRTFDSTWCCKSLKRRRQAADDNRLAACAPQNVQFALVNALPFRRELGGGHHACRNEAQ